MNHRKSMRIFLLTLAILLISGIVIIIVAYRAREQKMDAQRIKTEQTGQNIKSDTAGQTQYEAPDTDTDTTDRKPQVQAASGQTAAYRYEIKIANGCLDVYYYHTDRLFMHTGIPYRTLTIQQRAALDAGKYFVSEQELYGYLESCTS